MKREKQKNFNSVIADCLRKKFGTRAILYIKHFAEMTGSINAAILMSQLLYWYGKGSDKGWVYKTIEDMKDETGLSKGQQAKAIEIWKKADVLEISYTKTIPPKRNFKVNVDILLKFLDIDDICAVEVDK